MAYRGRGGPDRDSGFGFRRYPREMTKIKCSKCGKDAEVPFKPREGTPVYCKECFLQQKGITSHESKKPVKEESESTEEDLDEDESDEDSEEDSDE